MYVYIKIEDPTARIERYDYARLVKSRCGVRETNTVCNTGAFKTEVKQLCMFTYNRAANMSDQEYNFILTLPLLNDIKRLLFKHCLPSQRDYSHAQQWDLRALLKDCSQVAKFMFEHPNGITTLVIHE